MSIFEQLSDLVPHAASMTPRVDASPLYAMKWEQIAGALSAARPEGADLLRYMFAHDASAGRHVLARVRGVLMSFELEPKPRADLADLVLRVFAAPPQCPRCGGLGHVLVEKLKVDCARCWGIGLLSVTDARLASAYGVGTAAWRQGLKAPFDYGYGTLQRWNDQAVIAVLRKVRGGRE